MFFSWIFKEKRDSNYFDEWEFGEECNECGEFFEDCNCKNCGDNDCEEF